MVVLMAVAGRLGIMTTQEIVLGLVLAQMVEVVQMRLESMS